MKKFILAGIAFMLLPSLLYGQMDTRRLTQNPAWDANAVWSPDGSRIAFASQRGGASEIWAMDSTGEQSNLVQVTTNGFLDRNPCYQIGADSIVFASWRNGGGLFKICSDGTGMRRITDNNSDDYPDYSPDGVWIAFQSVRSTSGTEIYKMQDTIGQPSMVRLTINGCQDDDPCFSQDGSKIAFTSNRDGNYEICVMDTSGEQGGVDIITETEDCNNRGPSWSPDGRYIGFHSDRSGNYNAYYADSRGEDQGLLQLTNNTNTNGGIDWSPVEQTRIVFNSTMASGGGHEIFLGYNIQFVGVEDGPAIKPYNYELFQNYPNPFNPSTKIHYGLPEPTHVTLKVYNLLGQDIATLVDERQQTGVYTVEFDGSEFSSGIYFYVIKAGEFVKSRKMTLIK
jgi:Tol biopolymer transport system component